MSTLKFQYAYSEMASSANHSRLVSMTYPNGRVLDYTYGSGLDTSISRLTSIKDGANTLESYSYLGLRTVGAETLAYLAEALGFAVALLAMALICALGSLAVRRWPRRPLLLGFLTLVGGGAA